MRIGIIGPSNIKYLEKINKKAKNIVLEIAKIVAESNNEIVITPDKGSASEYLAFEYIKNNGKKIYEVVPLNEEEFGLSWLNLDLGKHINCNTWRNQPEKLNEETDILLCIGYAVGVLNEIAYTKWFNPKPVYLIKELISCGLPKEIEESLNLRYISINNLEKELTKLK